MHWKVDEEFSQTLIPSVSDGKKSLDTRQYVNYFRHDYIQMENSGLLTNSGGGLRGNHPSCKKRCVYSVQQQQFSDPSDFTEQLRFFKQRNARQAQSKINYYYRLKLFPKWLPFNAQGIKIKLNRLSLTSLFDRNNSWFSIAFDVFLALVVTLMATILIVRGVFVDFSLLIFAFVVAGSQFSLVGAHPR